MTKDNKKQAKLQASKGIYYGTIHTMQHAFLYDPLVGGYATYIANGLIISSGGTHLKIKKLSKEFSYDPLDKE